MAIRIFFKLFLVLLLLFVGFAQDKSIRHESMVWIEAIEKVKLNDRFSSTLLWHHRIFFDREETYQDIYWLSVNGKVSKNWSLTGGLMYFTYHKKAFDQYVSVPEWRPFQSVHYTKKLKGTKVTLRVMLEQRYTRRVGEGGLQSDHDFDMRLRNRAQVFIPLSSRLRVEISEEILLRDIHHGKGLFNQSRARARLHFSPGLGKLSINAGYLHWLVNTPNEYQHRHSVMVGLKHTLF